jgi:hypothetical protein
MEVTDEFANPFYISTSAANGQSNIGRNEVSVFRIRNERPVAGGFFVRYLNQDEGGLDGKDSTRIMRAKQ